MLDFYCEKGERIRVKKIYDFILKNSDVSQRQIISFSDFIADNLGLENDGMDEISVEEFDEEFSNYFKNNTGVLKSWDIAKFQLINNMCALLI